MTEELTLEPLTVSGHERLEVVAIRVGRKVILRLRAAERDDKTGEWTPGATSLDIPLHLAPDLRRAIGKAASRGVEHLAFGGAFEP